MPQLPGCHRLHLYSESWRHHDEEGLLKRVFNCVGLIQGHVEIGVDLLRHAQWVKCRTTNLDDAMTKTTALGRIGKQVFRQYRVQVEEGEGVESDVLGLLHQQFNGALVIQDHLRFAPVLASGHLAQLDQIMSIEPGVGIAFEPARCPHRSISKRPRISRA